MTISYDFQYDSGPRTHLYQRDVAHPNPLATYQSGFIPRRMKAVLQLAEFLALKSPHIFATVKKFGEYPITELQYESVSDGEKELRKDLYEDTLNLRGFLTECSFDKFVYGNVFVSIYRPFKRFLRCGCCGEKYDIRFCDYRFNLDKLTFTFMCPDCHRETVSYAHDEKITDKASIRLIRWDPKLVDIDYNPMSKRAVYYYTIPRADVDAVRNNSRVMIDDTPIEFLEAMQQRRKFRFAPGEVYHMRVPGPSGVAMQWGLPPVLAAIEMFLFAATLRRANEAIALDFLNPLRVLFPQAASGAGDPISTLSLSKWRQQVQENVARHRQDPLHVMIAPVPLGYQAVGGDGRALLTIAEIQEAEKNIVLAMNVPMEFLTGGLGQIRGEITLRMLENQLQTHIDDLNGLIQWVENKTSRYLGREPVKVKMAPFKMLDDDDRKQFLLQMHAAGKVSDTTVGEALDVDMAHERRQRKEDELAELRHQLETEREKLKIQTSLSQTAQQQAQSGGAGYNQQAIIALADQKVQEYLQLDDGSRQSQLDALQSEDLVMYAVVKERMQQFRQNEEQQMRAQQAPGMAA